MVTFKEQGNANEYVILRDDDWLASVQLNGELTADRQKHIMGLLVQTLDRNL